MTIFCFALGIICSSTYLAKVDVFYFNPSEQAFKDIYGGGAGFGAGFGIGLSEKTEIWLGLNYFSKQGELTYTREETDISILSLNIEGKYMFLPGKFKLYVAPGVNYNFFRESNKIGNISKNGIGFSLKSGGIVFLSESFSLDIFAAYTKCSMKPVDISVNIGGIEGGLGIRYKF